MANKFTKREFIKLLGMGSLGLIFWQCYDSKKESPAQSDPGTPEENQLKKTDYTDADVIFMERNDKRYNEFRKGFNKRFDRFPKIIALCFTTKGVQAAILKAKSESLKVSVKSGGHSFESFSCGDDTLLVNLSQMKEIKWLDDEKVRVQPGVLLQEIYDDFLPKKRIIPAGSCGTVGIAGLTLGGGYGFFSRRMGLTCDNLRRVKIVDGNGNILDTTRYPDILWACCGGGNGNFGVVTELDFQTHPAPDSFSSYRLRFRNMESEKLMQIMESWFGITDKLPPEAFSAFVLNGKTLTILITNYLKHSQEFENSFQALINLSDDYKPTKNQNLATALKRYYGRKEPLYFKNASAGLYRNFNEIKDIIPQVFEKVAANPGMIYQINTLGGMINHPELERYAAYPHRGMDYLSELQAYWGDPGQEKSFTTAFEEIQEIFRSKGIKAQYRNYPDVNFPDWENAYYGKNYEKLQYIKNKLDPDDLFNFEQSVRLS